MKGFIEVTIIDDVKQKSQKQLINIHNIILVQPKVNTYFSTEIIMTTNMGYLVVETYEEIKQKIKEATTEFEDFENRPYSKLCYECRQFKNCEIKQKYRDGSLFACGSFVNKK